MSDKSHTYVVSEDQTITKDLRRGFRLSEKILRPAEVITSKVE